MHFSGVARGRGCMVENSPPYLQEFAQTEAARVFLLKKIFTTLKNSDYAADAFTNKQ